MASGRHWEQDKEATVYVGNIDERVTDKHIWELMIQVGRVQNVHLPKDRVTQQHQGFGFVEFSSEEDADYASKIMNQIRLYGKPIRVNKASADKSKAPETGAELYVGKLDPNVDERSLYDTFGRFGQILVIPKIAREENGLSKGYGFVSFADFESSDDAIDKMNGQWMMNKQIEVQYAFKKDGSKNERHGDEAERALAAEAKRNNVHLSAQPLPPQFFATQSAASIAPTPPMPSMPQMPMPQMPMPQMPTFAPTASAMPRPYQPLPAAPSNLPARPPPSMAGYGGAAPGQGPPPGMPPGMPSVMPPGMPPGMPPPGMPPGMPQVPPPGFQMNGVPPMGYGHPQGFPQQPQPYGRR